MKKLFSFLFFFAAINIAFAQSKAKEKSFVPKCEITLGGIANGCTISIAQLIDFPSILNSCKNQEVYRFQFSVTSRKNGLEEIKKFDVKGDKLPSEIINYLQSLKGNSGKIALENITIIIPRDKSSFTENLNYTFNQ